MKNTQKRNVGGLDTHFCIQSEGQHLRLIFMGAYISVDHSSTKRDKNFICIVLVELMQKLNKYVPSYALIDLSLFYLNFIVL